MCIRDRGPPDAGRSGAEGAAAGEGRGGWPPGGAAGALSSSGLTEGARGTVTRRLPAKTRCRRRSVVARVAASHAMARRVVHPSGQTVAFVWTGPVPGSPLGTLLAHGDALEDAQ